jgi:hypothetical protein
MASVLVVECCLSLSEQKEARVDVCLLDLPIPNLQLTDTAHNSRIAAHNLQVLILPNKGSNMAVPRHGHYGFCERQPHHLYKQHRISYLFDVISYRAPPDLHTRSFPSLSGTP